VKADGRPAAKPRVVPHFTVGEWARGGGWLRSRFVGWGRPGVYPYPRLGVLAVSVALAEDGEVGAGDADGVAVPVLFEQVDEVGVELLEQLGWHRLGSGLHRPG